MISPLTPLDFLARSVHAWRDLTAVVEGDRRFTYAEFGARVERQAAALLRLGVHPGDRVAVLAPNGAMALEAHFAPMRIGAILVMLNTRLAPGELEWILHHSGAKVLLVDPQLKPLIANTDVPHVVADYEAFLGGAGASACQVRATLGWQAEACPTHAAQPTGNGQTPGAGGPRGYPACQPVTDENACIAVNYTSGTTGFPKG